MFHKLDQDHKCCPLRALFCLEADKAWNPVSFFINILNEDAACKILGTIAMQASEEVIESIS